MDATECEQTRQWVENWKRIGPELEAIRRREVREADNLHVIALLTDAFNHAATVPPRESSGMVEMQQWFAKLRK